MQGNRRLPKGKPLYVSYRCSCREQRSSSVCDNKEISKDYIEEYVLTELERHIFNDKSIPVIAEKVNKCIVNRVSENKDERIRIEKQLKEVNTHITNIVNAITSGFIQEEFKERMENLRLEKIKLGQKLVDININENIPEVTEENIKQLCSKFKEFVINRNIPECKKFIQDFVKEVIVFKDHVEVIFNMAFLLPKIVKL